MSNASLKRNPLPIEPKWLRAESSAREVKVDREANVLRGMVLAQEGNFKTPGRGAFNLKGLKQIKALINKEPKGLKSRFAHPTLSSDGIGKFLGRVKNPSIEVLRLKRDGEEVLINAVRGDLHFDKTALGWTKKLIVDQDGVPIRDNEGMLQYTDWVFVPWSEQKPLGVYVMDLAESDPDALSSSLVLRPKEEEQLDERGKPRLDKDGEPLPPLWFPMELHASDVVDTGDAVDGILAANLSTEGFPDELVRQGAALLNKQFPDAPRDVIRARCLAWLDQFLDHRFGVEEPPKEKPAVNGLSRGVVELAVTLAERGL